MKRKFLKGFTLVEVIVVMAIMSVLMVAIMQMFKPIRETFVDSTAYESQRSVQSGMAKYITESVRFATDLGFYTKGTVANPAEAVKAFADKYADANGFDATDPRYDEILKKAEVIVIDRATGYDWSSNRASKGSGDKGGHGRILRRKITTPPTKLTIDPTPTNVPNNEWRLALGTQYYGDDNDFTIKLGKVDAGDEDTAFETENAADGLKVTITSSSARLSLKGSIAISNSAEVLCPNLIGGGVNNNANAGITKPGIFDLDKYYIGSGTAPMTTATIYVVFLNEKI